jgi:hypothetical protein
MADDKGCRAGPRLVAVPLYIKLTTILTTAVLAFSGMWRHVTTNWNPEIPANMMLVGT